MQEIHFSTREAILYLALIGTGAGLVMGLVPLFYGWIKGKRKLGVIGLVVSIVAGAIWSVLPLFVMVIFVFLIARKSPLDSTLKEPLDESPDDDVDSVI